MERFPGAFAAFLGQEDDASLLWHKEPSEIRELLRTVGGVAQLALVDRKTVRRRGIAPGSVQALQFVVRERIRKGRPLVETKGGVVDHRNATSQFLAVINCVRSLKKRRKGVTVIDNQIKKTRKSGYGKNHRHIPGLREINDTERAEFADRLLFHYEPEGRVTVTMLCSTLKWSRQRFYKWKKELLKAQRESLETEMAANSPPVPTSLPSEPMVRGEIASDYADEYERIFAKIDGPTMRPA